MLGIPELSIEYSFLQERNVSRIRIELRTFDLGERWIENIQNWSQKNVNRRITKDKKRLQEKFQYLKEEKGILQERKAEEEYAERVKKARERCKKKIVYDLTKEQKITNEERELLSLGLNFGIALKKFPLVEYITSIEKLTQTLEAMDDAEGIQKASKNSKFSID